jgi:hypothetical protein
VARLRTPTVQDHVALAEIELCGELMIAASAVDDDMLSLDRIDEVLRAASEYPPSGASLFAAFSSAPSAPSVSPASPVLSVPSVTTCPAT